MQEVRVVHVHVYRRRHRPLRLLGSATRFATSFIPFWGVIRTVLLVVCLLFAYVKFWPNKPDVIPLVPGIACGPTMRPASGMTGVSYAVGAAVRKLNAEPPSVAQVQGMLSDAASAAGSAVGTFTAAVKGASEPLEQAPTAPPQPQVRSAADCGRCPGSVLPALHGGGALVAARAALRYWSQGDAVTAVAIAGAESRFDPRAVNSLAVAGSHAEGMWQTMMPMHAALFRGRDWRDPYANASVAHELWKASGWQPWTTFTNGSYRAFLGQARAAVARADGSSTASVLAVSTPSSGSRLQPITRAAQTFIRRQLGFRGAIGGYRVSFIAGTHTLSQHAKGLALDLMTSDLATGQPLADYFSGAGAGRWRVHNVIWQDRIWTAEGQRWKPYGDHGSPTLNHMDHVHVDFYGGAVPPSVAAAGAGCGRASSPVRDRKQAAASTGMAGLVS